MVRLKEEQFRLFEAIHYKVFLKLGSPTLVYFVFGDNLLLNSLQLSCSAVGNTVPEYRWTKNGVPVTDWQSTGVFDFKSLRKDNAGQYSCIASSDAGNIVSETITIHARG